MTSYFVLNMLVFVYVVVLLKFLVKSAILLSAFISRDKKKTKSAFDNLQLAQLKVYSEEIN